MIGGAYPLMCQMKKMNWLVGSYVGATMNLADVHKMQKLLPKEGFFKLIATPMGGNLVLLKTKDNSNVHALLAKTGECLGNVFSKLKPWEPEMVPRVTTGWLRVIGVPVHAWGEEFFHFISQLVGKLVHLDEDTSIKTRLDVGRVLVFVSSSEAINRTMKIKVNEFVFFVRMAEEVFFDHRSKD